MDFSRVLNVSVAFLVFLVVVFLISFIGDLAGEKSSTGPIKIFSWLCGSIIAFKIFEKMNDKDNE